MGKTDNSKLLDFFRYMGLKMVFRTIKFIHLTCLSSSDNFIDPCDQAMYIDVFLYVCTCI